MSEIQLESQIAAFIALGTLNTVQEIARAILMEVEDADPELVAEETLSLVSAVSGMAAFNALRAVPESRDTVVEVLGNVPHLYRDYVFGLQIMQEGDDEDFAARAEEASARLRRKQEFYRTHLPVSQFPTERMLRDKMGLWMGRVSPPGMPTSPDKRLEQMGLVEVVQAHARVIAAYVRSKTAA